MKRLMPQSFMLCADYSFALKLCQAASSIIITADGIRANIALKRALTPGTVLKSVKWLRVKDGCGSTFGSYIYRACPNLQVCQQAQTLL